MGLSGRGHLGAIAELDFKALPRLADWLVKLQYSKGVKLRKWGGGASGSLQRPARTPMTIGKEEAAAGGRQKPGA